MDKTVTIGSPTLNPGDYFYIRYRQLPGGAWVDVGAIDTNTFTLNNLADGNYELEVTYVFANGKECNPVVIPFTVDSDPPVVECDCLILSGVYVNKDCDNIITINATVATPYPDNCGVRITYSYNGGADTVVNYTNLNLPNQLTIPIQSTNNVKLKVEVLCCENEQWMVCYDSTIIDIRTCGCTSPPEITNETFTINPNSTRTYCIDFLPSNPDIQPYVIKFYPVVGMPQVFSWTVPTAGHYCFDLPENINASPGKWISIVSNPCGQDQGNGL